MESYRVGEWVEILDFKTILRMGKLLTKGLFTKPILEFECGSKQYTANMRLISTAKKVKIVSEQVVEDGSTHYEVEFKRPGGVSTLLIGPYLISRKLLSLVKCEITDRDRGLVINKAKEKERINRIELNKRVAMGSKLKPKGDIS